jgi:hypothetical protein
MRELGGLGEAIALAKPRKNAVTALYASAGHDTAPFAFLQRSFLARRAADQMPTPEVYVYVDREQPQGRRGAALSFDDERTVVVTDSIDELTVAGLPAWLLHVSHTGKGPGEKGSATVLRVRATNQEIYRLCARADWSPGVFIGVKDGCRFGGQDDGRCENMLEFEGSPLSVLPRTPGWWVTDHFGVHIGRIPQGYPIRSRDPAFPVEFTKIALLSSRWGFDHDLFGATVFQVSELEHRQVPRLRRAATV